MNVWLIRAGKHGEDEVAALETGYAIIGWQEMPDLSGVATYEAMKEKHVDIYPDMQPRAIQNNAAQLWAFSNRIKPGDVAVLPMKTRSVVAVGKITGGYEFKGGRHVRKVEWTRPDIPRTDFGQDLLYSIGAFMTVCQIKRNKAEERFAAEGLRGRISPFFNSSNSHFIKRLRLTNSDASTATTEISF